MTDAKSVSLFFREGSSDKVYNCQLVEADGGWRVMAQNGRRGGTLVPREKTKDALPYDAALKIFNKTVNGKKSDGYTEDASGAVFVDTDAAGRLSEFRPQLLNPLTREQGARHDEDWLAQEKHDGERRGIGYAMADGVWFSNRKGLRLGVQQPIHEAVHALVDAVPEGFLLDAEDMGGHVVVFDVIQWPGMPADAPLSQRAKVLQDLQEQVDLLGVGDTIRIDHPLPFHEFCRTRLAEIEARNGEGYVLKDPAAPYSAGRPNSGGSALKVKFTESVTARVTVGRDAGKRSVGLELLDGAGGWMPVGNVTIPGAAPIPQPGELIEVEYLYAYEGGSLFQPVFRGVRSDIDDVDCRLDRLKFKGGPTEPEADSPSP